MKIFTITMLLLLCRLQYSAAANTQRAQKNSKDTLVTISAAITSYYVKNNTCFVTVHLVVTNHSTQKLIYHVSDCSGDNYYTVDSKLLKIFAPACPYNEPTDKDLLPDSSHTADITLFAPVSLFELKENKFRIGFNVIELNAGNENDFYGAVSSDMETPLPDEVWSGYLRVQ